MLFFLSGSVARLTHEQLTSWLELSHHKSRPSQPEAQRGDELRIFRLRCASYPCLRGDYAICPFYSGLELTGLPAKICLAPKHPITT
jgi:hypothetical protein